MKKRDEEQLGSVIDEPGIAAEFSEHLPGLADLFSLFLGHVRCFFDPLVQHRFQVQFLRVRRTGQQFENVNSPDDHVFQPIEHDHLEGAPVPDQDTGQRDQVGADQHPDGRVEALGVFFVRDDHG